VILHLLILIGGRGIVASELLWKSSVRRPIILRMEDPTKRTIAEMLADMDASDAEIEAGQIVSGEAVRKLFDDTLARPEAKKAIAPRREANSRR
jgi:hypothetical protein